MVLCSESELISHSTKDKFYFHSLRWLSDLLYSAECGRSDTGRLLRLGLKETWSFTLLGHGPDSAVKWNWSGLLERRRTVGEAEPLPQASPRAGCMSQTTVGLPGRCPHWLWLRMWPRWGQSAGFGGIQYGHSLNPLSSEMVVGDWYSSIKYQHISFDTGEFCGSFLVWFPPQLPITPLQEPCYRL